MLTLTSPVETWAHRMRAGVKLALLAVATTGLFVLGSPLALAAVLGVMVGLYLSGGTDFAIAGLRLLRPLWPFVLIVALWHLWTGNPVGGLVFILRMLAAVALANFVTMTTRLSDWSRSSSGSPVRCRSLACLPAALPLPSRWSSASFR